MLNCTRGAAGGFYLHAWPPAGRLVYTPGSGRGVCIVAVESLTIRIPQTVYARLEEHAQQTQRSLEETLVEALAEAVSSPDDELPADVHTALAPLDTMPDDALREVARTSRLSPRGRRPP
jgi:hypothetical protein